MPTTNNIGAKRAEKWKKYRQLAFETRERHPGYEMYVVPVVVRALGGGIKALKVNLMKIFNNNELLDEVVAVMQKTVLMDSESIVRRVMSGLIQGENNEQFILIVKSFTLVKIFRKLFLDTSYS